MPAPGPFSRLSLIQATLVFMVAFFAINVLIDVIVFQAEPSRNLARHAAASMVAAPLWYFFIRWMRSRNG